jgi:SAM-dependent methyltransferase
VTAAGSSSRSRSSPYRLSALVYDRVYAWKDYAREARRVHELVQRHGPRPARTLLDVACGTGAHARYFARWYDVTGLDTSSPMLAVARRKLPRVRFVKGAMQSFRLPGQFDVITCLFSAIGYVRSEVDLRRTLANFARHLAPGGLVVLEPWLTPGEYREGSVHLGTYGTQAHPIARMNAAELRGGRSVMDMHYVVAADGRVRHWVERHDMGLFSVRTMLRAFRSAGLTARRLPSRFSTHRGLYVAVKEASPEPGDPGLHPHGNACAPSGGTRCRLPLRARRCRGQPLLRRDSRGSA